MTTDGNIHHEINYIEFSVSNIEEAKRFYRAAFDWHFNDYGPEYAGIRKQHEDGECGGICLANEVATGGPLVVIYSENLERSYELVKSAGGRITRETTSFPGGRRFQFSDPSGNELAVWSDKLADEPQSDA